MWSRHRETFGEVGVAPTFKLACALFDESMSHLCNSCGLVALLPQVACFCFNVYDKAIEVGVTLTQVAV